MTEEEKRKRARYLQLKKKRSATKQTPISEPVVEQKGLLRQGAEYVVDSPALPIAGGIVGGAIGGIPGAALGGATGESYRQMAARFLDLPSPKTSLDAATDIGVEGITQGLGEGAFRVAKPLAKSVANTPFVKPAVEAVGSGIKKTSGQLFQLLTKIKPKDASTLFKNPKAILPGEWTKAQVAWRKAAEDAGLPIDEVSPEIINALKKDARSTAFDTFTKIRSGEPVRAADAQIAKQALDIALMPAAKNEKNAPLVSLLGKMRKKFMNRIGEESPELAKANREYGIARAGKKFRTFFPQNIDDSPAYVRGQILPAIVAGMGYQRGEPWEGAGQAAALSALSSPIGIGTGIAMAGAGRPLVPHIRRAVTGSIAEIGKKKFRKNEDR